MTLEIIFWAALALFSVILAVRGARRARSRAVAEALMSEAFERHRHNRVFADSDGLRARERLLRETNSRPRHDEWAA